MCDSGEHKLFWNYAQFRRKGSNDLIVTKLDYGNVLTNEGGIAECMNKYFASVFKAENFHHLIKLSKTRILVFYTVHLRMLATF